MYKLSTVKSHRNEVKGKTKKGDNSYIEKPKRGFWREINKYRGKKRCIASTIESLANPTLNFGLFCRRLQGII